MDMNKLPKTGKHFLLFPEITDEFYLPTSTISSTAALSEKNNNNALPPKPHDT